MMTATLTIEKLTLDTLVRRAVEGDQHAWREIERRYRQMASGVARQAGVRPGDVPDVLQHVWLQLFVSLPKLREPAYLAAWIRTTARRESIRVLRQQSRQVLADDIETVQPPRRPGGDAMDEAILRHDVKTEMARAADGLTPRCRQLVGVLMADPGSSYQEIAETLDWPMGSVGPTKARCFARLQQLGHLDQLAC
jgi:RNA polymerase sigma factor (sigma-70 family)